MGLYVLGGAVILGFTGYAIAYTYQVRERLTCMVGMMIAMAIGMISSLPLGLIAGLYTEDFSKATLIAVLYGLATGYWAGKPVSLMASIDGMLSGLMGGMMGAMLGGMLTSNRMMMLVLFLFVFLFIMFVLLQLIRQETGNGKPGNRLWSGSFLTLVLGAGIIALWLAVQGGVPQETPVSSHHHNAAP
jgi:hypothetical protein